LINEGSDAWAAFVEHELDEARRAEAGFELHRLARAVRSYRRSLRGDATATMMLETQLDCLNRMFEDAAASSRGAR
jgi:hypothetical protein